MNTTELYHHLLTVCQRKYYELKCKSIFTIFWYLASEETENKVKAIEEVNEHISEYSKKRRTIKRQIVERSIDWIKGEGMTARVDEKLSGQLSLIVRKIKKLLSPFQFEFKEILNILIQMKIRKKKKKFWPTKASIKSSQLKNVSFNWRESSSLLSSQQ